MRNSILATMLIAGTIVTSSFSKEQYYPSMGQGNMMHGQGMHQGMASEPSQGVVKYNQNMPYGTQNNMMNQYSMPYGNMHGYGMNNNSMNQYSMPYGNTHGYGMHNNMMNQHSKYHGNMQGYGMHNNMMNQYGMHQGNMQGYGMHNNMMNQHSMHQGNMQGYGMHNNMMNQYGMHHGKQYGKSGYGNHMFARLNLSSEQNYKISILRDEMYLQIRRQKLTNPYKGMMSYILDNGFDKESFMLNRNNQYQKIMEIKAIHMEKVFNVLTKEQIAELKKYYESKSK